MCIDAQVSGEQILAMKLGLVCCSLWHGSLVCVAACKDSSLLAMKTRKTVGVNMHLCLSYRFLEYTCTWAVGWAHDVV